MPVRNDDANQSALHPSVHEEEEDAQRSELPERKQRLLDQLDEWLADDSGYDEETWPKLKAALEQDRLSSRSLFDE